MVEIKKKTSVRKKPRQQRSLALVDSILEASARVLSDAGFDQSTTNRIAEIAGVSIGSLYQYFPGKESLIAALVDHQIEKNLKAVEKALVSAEALPLEEMIEVLSHKIVDTFLIEAGFFKKLFSVAPRLGRLETVAKSRQKGAEFFEKILQNHTHRLTKRSLPHLAFVSVNAVMGVIQIAGLTGMPAEMGREELSSELARLLRGYLVE